MHMKPILFNYLCENCNVTFKAPELPEVYGEFIMRSNKANDSVYLNSFNDKVFDEVEDLFKNNEMIKNTDRAQDTILFQSNFSISCDLASDGSQYKIGVMPTCPNCGSRNMASWGLANPSEFLTEDIQSATHECWNRLTHEEKVASINECIKSHLEKE